MIGIAFCLAFAIFFIHVTTWDSHIFHGVNKLTENWPEWIRKPLFDCPICMSPWWGMAIQGVFNLIGITIFSNNIMIMFFTCMVAGGINVLNVIAAKAYDIMTDE